jgi:hypothetical protein
MIPTRLFLLLLMPLIAAGCATLDKSECLEADWTIIGLEDGAGGKPVSYIGRHREACAEHGVKPDLASYRRGHAEGLVQFCNADNGFRLGRSGRAYNNVCPSELSGQFLAGYETGRQLHDLSSDIDHMLSDVESMRAELDDATRRQRNIENLLVSGTISASVRQSLLDQFKNNQVNIAALEVSIRDTELEAARLQGEYDVLNASHPYLAQ